MEAANKRILIVESDSDTIFILAAKLVQAGYAVENRRNGVEIVEGKLHPPDLFLIDKDLPIIDGIALCKYLKINQRSENVPVVMISCSNIKATAMRAGVDEFLTKPFDTTDLLKTLERCLMRAARNPSNFSYNRSSSCLRISGSRLY